MSREAWVVKDLDLTLRPIPAGVATLGSPYSEAGRRFSERPAQQVRIEHEFWMACTTVTQQQWQMVMGTGIEEQLKKAGAPPGKPGKSGGLPMSHVSWAEANAFCAKLTDRERAAGRLETGWRFALPTEVEWEYSCRAGTDGTFSSVALDRIAWFRENSGKRTLGLLTGHEARPVGTKEPNAWGLSDMIGNLRQWCADDFREPTSASRAEPPPGEVRKMLRGSSFESSAPNCRAAFRDASDSEARSETIGFRIALVGPGSREPNSLSAPERDARGAGQAHRCLVVGRGIDIREATDRASRKKLVDLPLEIAVQLNEQLARAGLESSLALLERREFASGLSAGAGSSRRSTEAAFAREVERLRDQAKEAGFGVLVLFETTSVQMRVQGGATILADASFQLRLVQVDTGTEMAAWTKTVGSNWWSGYLRDGKTFADSLANDIATRLK